MSWLSETLQGPAGQHMATPFFHLGHWGGLLPSVDLPTRFPAFRKQEGPTLLAGSGAWMQEDSRLLLAPHPSLGEDQRLPCWPKWLIKQTGVRDRRLGSRQRTWLGQDESLLFFSSLSAGQCGPHNHLTEGKKESSFACNLW